MHDVHGVVDVEGDGLRRLGIAGAPEIDHDPTHPDHIAQPGCILPARHGRLAHQVRTALRQPSAGQLEGGVGSQAVEVVGVLVAAGNREDPRPQDVGQIMGNPGRVARVGDDGGQLVGNPEAPFSQSEQHHATIRADPPAIESGGHFLAADRWQGERQEAIVEHGGCGRLRAGCGTGLSNQILSDLRDLRYIRQPQPVGPVNKGG